MSSAAVLLLYTLCNTRQLQHAHSPTAASRIGQLALNMYNVPEGQACAVLLEKKKYNTECMPLQATTEGCSFSDHLAGVRGFQL